MNYVFHFEEVLRQSDVLLAGAGTTLRLSFSAMAAGFIVALLCACGSCWGPRPVRWMIKGYVEVIRNTPFLVQLYFIFFGLPALGIRLSVMEAAFLTMVVNAGAYTAEIVRAGFEAVPGELIEAAAALGLRPIHIFRHVIFKPALQAVFPALSSQFVLLLLGSSVTSAISVDELTQAASVLDSVTFRSLEVYGIAAMIYAVLSLGLGFLLSVSNVYLFPFSKYLRR